MTDLSPPPPPDPGKRPADPAQRRKRVAIGINVVLLLGIVAAVVLNGGDDDDAQATAVRRTTTTVERTDDSDAFVTGIQRSGGTTTTAVSTTLPATDAGTDPDGPADPDAMPAETTTTTAPGPPELTGELDEFGVPVGLEFPLYNSEHTIIGGENLWLIAANQLAALTDRAVSEVSNTEVARYWERVIELNHPTLISGDPNLVYPGEVVRFPDAG